jgi:hypothetical protein
MNFAGKQFSVSLAGVEFREVADATVLIYTEQAFFLEGDDDAASRQKGTNGLLDQLTTYITGMT